MNRIEFTTEEVQRLKDFMISPVTDDDARAVLSLIALAERATEAATPAPTVTEAGNPASPAAAAPTIHCQEFHELAMNYRGAQAFSGAAAAYEQLTGYIDAELASARKEGEEAGRAEGYAKGRGDAVRDYVNTGDARLASAGAGSELDCWLNVTGKIKADITEQQRGPMGTFYVQIIDSLEEYARAALARTTNEGKQNG